MSAPIAEYVAETSGTVAALIRRPGVARCWQQESSCEGMTVGALAFHLADQVRHVLNALAEPPREEAPIAVLEHYRRAAWVRSGLDEEPNTSVRDDAEDKSTAGPDELQGRLRADLAALPSALQPAVSGERQPNTVFLPWQGWALTTQDFLVTRLMEMVVHADDLAVSIGEEPPEFSTPVIGAVLGLLAGVAAERHGQAALVRALSRPQRAPSSVSAF